ncbi:MAG: ADP-ribosylglycohydrolase family protein, partial [Chloroflexia bacterium]
MNKRLFTLPMLILVLAAFLVVGCDSGAHIFAQTYDPLRGYGPAMHSHLGNIRQGVDWKESASSLFSGRGSFGNGSAMRVAPLGAYFADDLDMVVQQAALSAEVTHTHPEAEAGAIAVAVAAALAWQAGQNKSRSSSMDFLNSILAYVPPSEVAEKIKEARDLHSNASIRLAVSVLGSGEKVSAQDTVPFALWCASKHLDNFEDAFWFTLEGLGDRDTTCAMVGGIVACYTGTSAIPSDWIEAREALPRWSYNSDASQEEEIG